MKIIQKYTYILAGTLLMGSLLLMAHFFSGAPVQQISPETVLEFQLLSNGECETILPVPGDDGTLYVFLPAYAQMNQLSVHLTQEAAVTLGGKPVTEGMDCSFLEPGSDYYFASPLFEDTLLRIRQSANVPTLYIRTLTGSMDRIHQDKRSEESAAVSLYTSDGSCTLPQAQATIQGRGNSTWQDEPKKPYNLTFDLEADLLGLGAASRWTLLANALDESNLRNKIVFDFAKQLNAGWVPECRYVDVYLNGTYSGLYLLIEKVEAHPSRLVLDTQNGDFLCKLDFQQRWTSLRNPFQTALGRTIEISAPAALNNDAGISIQNQVNALEHAILSGDDLARSTLLDMDSWVRKYLIDEIFMNFDADLASSYFYCQDGVFYAGPLWDYDMILGSTLPTQNPSVFYANLYHKYAGSSSPYYSALYQNRHFQKRVRALYELEFLPLLEQLLSSGFDAYTAEISQAAENNRLRWFPHSSQDVAAFADSLSEFLTKRIDFLNRAWIDETPVCTVQLLNNPYGLHRHFSVTPGTLLDPNTEVMQGVVWLSGESEEPFDFSQPIAEDLLLVAEGMLQPSAQPLTTQDKLALGTVLVMILLLTSLAAIDIRHRRKERRRELGRTKISP